MGVDHDASYGIGARINGERIIEIAKSYEPNIEECEYEAIDVIEGHTDFYGEQIGMGGYDGSTNDVIICICVGNLEKETNTLTENIAKLRTWLDSFGLQDSEIGLQGGVHVC